MITTLEIEKRTMNKNKMKILARENTSFKKVKKLGKKKIKMVKLRVKIKKVFKARVECRQQKFKILTLTKTRKRPNYFDSILKKSVKFEN